MVVMLKNGDILVFEPCHHQLIFSELVHQNSENQNVPFFPVAQVVDTITSLQDVEAQHISQLLQEYNNNRRRVAETLEDLRNCSI